MKLPEAIIPPLCGITMLILMIIDAKKEIKQWRNQAPNGKDFIKNFSKALLDIRYCQQIYTNKGIKDNKQYIDYVPANVNNTLFKVKVLKDNTPEGLEYSTIPRYKSYTVYINDEPVCREHIFNDKSSFEFTCKRERDEVIQIVMQAYEVARPDVEADHKRIYSEWLSTKSYFKENE